MWPCLTSLHAISSTLQSGTMPPPGSNRPTKSLPRRIISDNHSGKSIVLRTIFCILFFLSSFSIIGVYYFVDARNHPPSCQRIALLSCLIFFILICFAGTVLPWEILLYPFKNILRDEEKPTVVQTFSYMNNLQMLPGYSEPDGAQGPSPLMKRTFTVLKKTLRPNAQSAADDSFRVINEKTGPPTSTTPSEGAINPSSTPLPSLSRVASLSSTSKRSQSPSLKRSISQPTPPSRQRSVSNRNQRPQPPQILRITHPMESTTVHQTTSKQSADRDYVTPPLTRRNTGASERPPRLEGKVLKPEEKLSKFDFNFEWDPEDGMLGVMKKLERLSTVGEGEDEASPPYFDVEKPGMSPFDSCGKL